MSSLLRDNAQNPRVGCVSSSKVPPCDSYVANDLKFKGSLGTFATAGETVIVGNVLSASTVVDKQVVLSPGATDLLVVGVALNGASAGDAVCMAVGGEFKVLVTGVGVTRGDILGTSATPGIAEVAPGVGAFAVVMNSDAGVIVRLVCAKYLKAEQF